MAEQPVIPMDPPVIPMNSLASMAKQPPAGPTDPSVIPVVPVVPVDAPVVLPLLTSSLAVDAQFDPTAALPIDATVAVSLPTSSLASPTVDVHSSTGIIDTNIDPVLLAQSLMLSQEHKEPQMSIQTSAPDSPLSSLLTGEEPPPSTQPHVPCTHVTPPTPYVTALCSTGEGEGSDLPLPSSAGESKPSTPSTGQCTARVNAILADGYDKLEGILMKIVGETSLLVQQVMDGWHKSRGRAVGGTNHWNLYACYFAKHEEQELRHLGLPEDTLSKFPFTILQTSLMMLWSSYPNIAWSAVYEVQGRESQDVARDIRNPWLVGAVRLWTADNGAMHSNIQQVSQEVDESCKCTFGLIALMILLV